MASEGVLMALVPQKVPLKFGALNTKTDARHVVPGDLLAATNVVFDNWPKIRKRPGYGLLGTAASGSSLAAFKSQLLVGTGSEAFSYAASGLVDKGVLESLSVSVRAVRRDAYAQTTPDSAVHPLGVTVYTWETTAGGSAYAVYDSATGQPIVSGASLGATAVKPKALALGSNVIVLFYDTATNKLRYISIPAINPTSPTAAADLAADPATTQIFDATVVGGLQGSLFLAYANNGGANKISLRYLTAQGTLSATTVPTTTEAFSVCCAVFGDTANRIWIAYYTGAAVKAFAYDFTLATKLIDFTPVDAAPGTVRNITGIVPTDALATILYEVTGSASYNNLVKTATMQNLAAGAPTLSSAVASAAGGTLAAGTYYYKVTALGASGETLGSNELSAVTTGATSSVVLTWTAVQYATGYRVYRGTAAGAESVFYAPGNVTTYTDTNAASTAGAVPTTSTYVGVYGLATLIRSVGLASKPFYYLGRTHVLVAYQSALQNTYFLVSGVGAAAVAKLAPSLGGGLTAKSILPEITNPATGIYGTAYLQTDQLSSSGGNVFTQAGVMAGTFDFTQPQTAVELSDNLHLTGGVLSMYDGQQVCEHGFHLYPENLAFTSGGAGAISGSYQACAVYEWMDAQGLIHQSAPSPVVTITAASALYFNYTVQSLRVTNKTTPVSVVFYRTLANQTVFYRVSSIASPNLNTTTADTVSAPVNGDTAADASLSGNAQLYANPNNIAAEIPNVAAPATLSVWRYRNRVAAIPAENPFQWFFSKAFIPGVPIEFNEQQLYQSVAQDGGPLTCGIEMDEKNILFTASRIYYVIGDGPAANASSPDYGASPQNIPSDVGCTNRRSTVLTPQGVMFQSAKGIYLLGRDLSVRYIGAPVEAFNGLTITSAKLVPNSRRVIFFTNGGIALAWDYFAEKWAVFKNHNAIDAAIFGGLVTYLQAGGGIMQETPGLFTDNGSPILIGLTTSWLSFAGLSGFQRVWRFMLRGDYRSQHSLVVSVAYDDNPAWTQQEVVNAGTLLGTGAVADTTTGGTDNPGDGSYPAYEMLVKVKQQKCASLQITIQEAQPVAAYGEGFSLSGITFLVGATGKGLHPVPAGRVI